MQVPNDFRPEPESEDEDEPEEEDEDDRRKWFCDLIDAAEEEPYDSIQKRYGDVEQFMSGIGIQGPVGTTTAIKFSTEPFYRFYNMDDVKMTDNYDENEHVDETYTFNESTEQWEQESSDDPSSSDDDDDEDEEGFQLITAQGVTWKQKGLNVYTTDTDELVFKENPSTGKLEVVNREIYEKKKKELKAEKEKKKKKKVS
eukprot:SAG11_NODE_3268_length_2567_cov_11.570502_1_plen_200_part_00